MRYKREEAFRFQFRTPLEASVKIIKENGSYVAANVETAEIMDVSPHGVKFKTPLNLLIPENQYLIEVIFVIEGKMIHQLGHPVWKKVEGKNFSYGFNAVEDERTKKEIIQALKDFSRKVIMELKQK
ncbi:PilZ domain-containing protein [Bacillus sp. JJ1532]|uniref:PilZ domain-containing protein n=1 Tax=Bacillus sp. JJ1532 TaxID=3122958 RepID=UPI002FFD5CDC